MVCLIGNVVAVLTNDSNRWRPGIPGSQTARISHSVVTHGWDNDGLADISRCDQVTHGACAYRASSLVTLAVGRCGCDDQLHGELEGGRNWLQHKIDV